MKITNRMLFWFGVIWLAVFYFIFTNIETWSFSLCSHDYACQNRFEVPIYIFSLIPSLLFLVVTPLVRRIALFSGVIAALFIIGLSFVPDADFIAYFLFPIVFITPISVILLAFREEVFRAWLKFAYVWIPLSIILIALSANSSGGGWAIPNILDQEFVAIILSGLFVFISLLIILVSWLRSRSV